VSIAAVPIMARKLIDAVPHGQGFEMTVVCRVEVEVRLSTRHKSDSRIWYRQAPARLICVDAADQGCKREFEGKLVMSDDSNAKLATQIAVGCLGTMVLALIAAIAFGTYLLSTAPREKIQAASNQMEEQVLGINVFITESQNRTNHLLLYSFLALAGISLLAGRRAFRLMSSDATIMKRLPKIESQAKALRYGKPPPQGSFKFALFCILTIFLGEAFIITVFGSDANHKAWPVLIIFLLLVILVRELIRRRVSK